MLSFIKNIKTSVILLALLLVAIISVGWYISHLHSEIDELTAANIKCATGLSVSEASVSALDQALSKQGKAIEQLKKDAEARFKASQESLAKARAESEKYKKIADDLMKRTPQSANLCESANFLINEEIRRGKK